MAQVVEHAFITADIFFQDTAHGILDRFRPDHIVDDGIGSHVIGLGRRFQPVFWPGHAAGIGIHAAHRIHEHVVTAVAAKHIGQRIENRCLFIVFIIGQEHVFQDLTPQEVQFFFTGNGKSRVQVNRIKILADDMLAKGMERRDLGRWQQGQLPFDAGVLRFRQGFHEGGPDAVAHFGSGSLGKGND